MEPACTVASIGCRSGLNGSRMCNCWLSPPIAHHERSAVSMRGSTWRVASGGSRAKLPVRLSVEAVRAIGARSSPLGSEAMRGLTVAGLTLERTVAVSWL